jgi:hypothetical protein
MSVIDSALAAIESGHRVRVLALSDKAYTDAVKCNLLNKSRLTRVRYDTLMGCRVVRDNSIAYVEARPGPLKPWV